MKFTFLPILLSFFIFYLPGIAFADIDLLNNNLSALQSSSQGSSEEQRLIETIIRQVREMDSKPSLPDEVIEHEGRAEAAVNLAKTPQDYLDAAKEYRKAIRIAPWVASYHFNLGVVLEKAGKPIEAIKSLKLYLLAAPDAPDVRDVKKKIAGLKFQQEKAVKKKDDERAAQRDAERKKRAEKETLARMFNGEWKADGFSGSKFIYQVSASGSNISIVCYKSFIPGIDTTKCDSSCCVSNWPTHIKGNLNGKSFYGSWNDNTLVPCKGPVKRDVKGYLDSNNRKLVIEYKRQASRTASRTKCWWEGDEYWYSRKMILTR